MQSKRVHLLAPVLLLLPGIAAASSIFVNGSCVGTCDIAATSTDALQSGQSVGPSSGNFVFPVNGDSYRVNWTFTDSYIGSPTQLSLNASATYTGASPTAQADTFTFDFYQKFYDTTRANWNGNYTENLPLTISASAGAASSVNAQLFYNGNGLGLATLSGPGTNSTQHVSNLVIPNGSLIGHFAFQFTFGAGTLTNASEATPSATVPEPGQMLPLGIVLAGAAVTGLRRRRVFGAGK